MSPASDTPPTRPIPNSYWVIPGRLLAGEYPAPATEDDPRGSLERLLETGFDCFIDLTMPDELDPYDGELPLAVEYLRKPIPDHGLPAERAHMTEILYVIEQALHAGRRIYLHCRAGIGRTGMVVGCLLAERGKPGEAALEELNRLWRQCDRSRDWHLVPETPEQIAYVRSWIPGSLAALRDEMPFAPREPVAAAPAPSFPTGLASSAKSLRERFLGALVGLAVGDALAAPTQSQRPGTFAPVTDLTGGGPFQQPPGAWSDDTALALCIAESLLERNGFDPRDQVERCQRWRQEGYLSATGHCIGITPATARALALAQWRRQVFPGSHDPQQLDPEPLSRVAPVALFYFPSAQDTVRYAGDAARITCQAPTVVQACGLLAAILHGALSGWPKDRVLAPEPRLFGNFGLKPRVAALARGAYPPEERARSGVGSDVVDVLKAALRIFQETESYREGALRAVNLGGPSDVVCAVYGQLAGAYYGLGGIPSEWRNALARKELVLGFAERLIERAQLGLDR